MAYDAGAWTETKAEPTTNATFGGYTGGTNKATGVNGTASGWQVISKTGNGASGKVSLISAGSPWLFYVRINRE